MELHASVWLLLNIATIIFLSFYSMMEMACISFNKVRLQYYVSKGNQRAIWLNYLLHNPSRLFGTTLIGVNIAMFAGSECAREFNRSIGLDPDLAPLTQVLIVVVFGELAPMFAARRYPEHVAMIGVPLVYASAKIMMPFIWGIGIISRLCNWMISGRQSEDSIFLSQEELMKIIEDTDEDKPHATESEDFNAFSTNIFSLRQKDVRQIMEPMQSVSLVPSTTTVGQVISLIKQNGTDYIAVYHKDLTNIVGITHVRDLLRLPDNRRIREHAKAPWFVTQNTKVMQILKQFRRNNEDVAVILNEVGHAVGMIKLEDVVEEIFGKNTLSLEEKQKTEKSQYLVIEKTLPGSLTIGDFNRQFKVVLDPEADESLTLADFIVNKLGHHPEVGESIFVDPFELSVKETSLLEIKSIAITTHLK
jgi:CBS domain containing-hemolysin-like protein